MTYPDWLDRDEYPFDGHYLELPAGRMHYLDEGTGPAVVMVHGTPEWSFGYRKLVAALAPRYRCLVPDHLGFGLSDRPSDYPPPTPRPPRPPTSRPSSTPKTWTRSRWWSTISAGRSA